MENMTEEQPAPRERVGSRAWVRTAGLVGGGLMAGGILAGTLTANAATDDSTTTPPSVTQEDGTTTDGTTAPEDCPEGAGPRGGGTTTPDDGTTPDERRPPPRRSGPALARWVARPAPSPGGPRDRRSGRAEERRPGTSASGVNGRRSQVDSSRFVLPARGAGVGEELVEGIAAAGAEADGGASVRGDVRPQPASARRDGSTARGRS